MPLFRFQAVIARQGSIRRVKSFQGRPRTRQQQLELTHDDVKTIAASLDGVPVCYNHAEKDVLGRVERNWIADNGDWTVQGSIDLDTPRRKEMAQWIRDNKLRNVSLCHTMNGLRAKEVSLCFKGARPATDVLGGEVVAAAASNEDDYNLPEDDQEDTNEAITYVAASAMELPPPAAPVANTPVAEAAPAATTVPMDVDTAFATTAEISTILANPSRIPTGQEREQVRAKVSALELEKLKLAEEKRLLEEQIKSHKETMDKAIKEAEERGKTQSEEQKRIETEQQLAGDLLKTMAGGGVDNKDVATVLASIGKPGLAFLAARGREFVAAAASPETIVESEVDRNVRAWKEYMKRSTTTTPAAAAPAAAAAPQEAMQHPGVFKSLAAAAATAPAAAVVQASYVAPRWGMPITQRTPGVDQDVAASSGESYRYSYGNVEEKPEYAPGEGPNFYWGFMQNEAQINVYRGAKADSYTDGVSYKKLGLSQEAMEEHMRLFDRNAANRASRSQTAATSFNSRGQLLSPY